jgi:hypothetical protein
MRIGRTQKVARGRRVIRHAKAPWNSVGVHENEALLLKALFEEPWLDRMALQKDFYNIVRRDGSIATWKALKSCSTRQFFVVDKILAVCRKRLKILFPKTRYELRNVNFTDIFHRFINENQSFDPRWGMAEIPTVLLPKIWKSAVKQLLAIKALRRKPSGPLSAVTGYQDTVFRISAFINPLSDSESLPVTRK